MRRLTGALLLLLPCAVLLSEACGSSDNPNSPPPPPPPPAPVASVVVTPAADTLIALNDVHQFHAVARDSAGALLTGRTVTWSSSDTTIATVSFAGWARARRDGTAQITAEVEGVRASGTVHVAQRVTKVVIAPDTASVSALTATHRFLATAFDVNLNPVPGIRFQWISADPQVATVDSTGLATSQDTGAVAITATYQGVADTARLRIVQVPVRLKFTSLPIGVVAGVPFSPDVVAEVQDAMGHRVKGDRHQVIVWLVFDPANAPLNGTTTLDAVDGVVHFTGLHIDRALSGYALALDSPDHSLLWDIGPYFDVAPAAATHLAFTWIPSAPFAADTLFYVDVQIQDPLGNVVPSDTSPVTLSLAVNPWGDPLPATTVNAVNGIATFSVRLSAVGTGYAFGATSPGLASGQSLPFDIILLPGGSPAHGRIPRR